MTRSVFLLCLLLAVPAQAESDFCAGQRVGFLLTYCPPRNQACLTQRTRCFETTGTFADGFTSGKRLAESRLRLEIKAVINAARRAEKNKDQRND